MFILVQVNKIQHLVSTIQPKNSWFHYLQRFCTTLTIYYKP